MGYGLLDMNAALTATEVNRCRPSLSEHYLPKPLITRLSVCPHLDCKSAQSSYKHPLSFGSDMVWPVYRHTSNTADSIRLSPQIEHAEREPTDGR